MFCKLEHVYIPLAWCSFRMKYLTEPTELADSTELNDLTELTDLTELSGILTTVDLEGWREVYSSKLLFTFLLQSVDVTVVVILPLFWYIWLSGLTEEETINPFTARGWKRPKKVQHLKPVTFSVLFFALACERIFTETHSIESRCYRSGKYSVLQACACNLQHINFTGWGSEGVKSTIFSMSMWSYPFLLCFLCEGLDFGPVNCHHIRPEVILASVLIRDIAKKWN